MRLHRLEISNFGGVDHAEVNFRDDGVTVIEGPNEAGKTTLRDAFARLLDTKANSSNHKKIGKYFPVHSDVGPEVTAEFSTGPYRLVYTKQWKTGKRTELRFLEPTNDNLTGDAAHERVEEILNETLDEGLWNVLQHAQGTSWDEFTPVESTAFLGALDAASGGERFSQDGSSESLWDRVETEREQFFTAKGRPREKLISVATKLEEAKGRLEEVDRELRAIEVDAKHHDELSSHLAELETEEKEATADLDAANAVWAEIAGIQVKRTESGHIANTAQSQADAADNALAMRKKLIKQFEDANDALATLDEDAKGVETELAGATSEAEKVREGHGKAAQALRDAQKAEGKADSLLKLIEEWHSLADRKTRRDTAKTEIARIAKAEATLEKNPVDDEARDQITVADANLRDAATRLDAAKLSMRLKATCEVEVTSPVGESALKGGDKVEFDVAAGDEVVIGDVATIEVLGTDAQRDLAEELADADAQLKALAKEFGLSGKDAIGSAMEKNRERDRAEQTLESSRKSLKAALRNITFEELVGKVERQEERFAKHAKKTKPEDLNDSAAATKAKEAAARDREAAESDVARLEADRADADEAASKAREKSAATMASLAAAKAGAAADAKSLKDSRKDDGSDEQLEKQLTEKKSALAEAAKAQATFEKQLMELNAEAREAERTAASGRVDRLARELRLTEAELNQVTGRLGRDSGKGLLEARNKAASDVAHSEREEHAVSSRAEAVKLLHAKLAEHRDAARRAVVKPYAERIERLGKIVFGPDVEFAVSAETLRIESRTMDGRTVAFESLSGGAKEQIGVISALACAELVATNNDASDRGAPIVLDDALGFSDDARLKSLGAAFSAASDDCQVIILTCNRDRYKSIGDADFVKFGPSIRIHSHSAEMPSESHVDSTVELEV